MDLDRLLNILVEKIKRDYRDDIAILHVHGSYVYHDTHSLSDLDIYFVPKTKRGCTLGCTFILEGIGCDFWALSWERLERIAAHQEKTASIITDGAVLYYSSEDDLKRFNDLKYRALDTSDHQKFLDNAKQQLSEAKHDYLKLQVSTTISDARVRAIGMIYTLSFALSLLNRVTIKRGRKLLKDEILAMPLIPDDFAILFDSIFFAAGLSDIKTACTRLLKNTSDLFESVNRPDGTSITFAQAFDGWYEEMIQSYNKIYHACEVGDIYTPLFAAAELTTEMREMFERSGTPYSLPDLAGAYDAKDLTQIKRAAGEHQKQFIALLHTHAVPIRQFESFDALQAFLDIL